MTAIEQKYVNLRTEPRRLIFAKSMPFFEDALITFRKYQFWRLRGQIDRMMAELLRQGCPLHRVEIETINQCDGHCNFCPCSRGNDRREPAYMSDKIFLQVLEELRSMGFQYGISLMCNGEPFLDHQIVERAALARRMLPDANISLYTNGRNLTPAKYRAIMPSLDWMMIDNYNDSMKVHGNIRRVLEDAPPSMRSKTTLYLRREHDIFNTVAGTSPSRKKAPTYDIGCVIPFCETVVTPKGNMSICCQDAQDRFRMGSIVGSSIMDVWHSEKFQQVRSALITKRRAGVPLCRPCDCLRRDIDEYIWMRFYNVERVPLEVI